MRHSRCNKCKVRVHRMNHRQCLRGDLLWKINTRHQLRVTRIYPVTPHTPFPLPLTHTHTHTATHNTFSIGETTGGTVNGRDQVRSASRDGIDSPEPNLSASKTSSSMQVSCKCQEGVPIDTIDGNLRDIFPPLASLTKSMHASLHSIKSSSPGRIF